MSRSRRIAAVALSALALAGLFASSAVAKNPPVTAHPPTTANPPGPH
jgi:hypothetical protein